MVNNSIVNNDLKNIYNKNEVLFRAFAGKTVLITGATGLLGSFLVRSFLYADKRDDLNIGIVVLVRSEKKAKEHFGNAIQDGKVKLIIQDITKPVAYSGKVDYIIHAASNTESQSFVVHPVATLDVAVIGTKNILELARVKKVDGIAYLSSMEVYGELEVDRGLTKEEDLGYVDILRARSSYQMGKRIAESYCSYYAQEYGVPVKIARLSQIVSSNTPYDDHRVVAYFARCVVEKKDIVLNTPAEVVRSFCYVTDAISAILTILIKGQNGESYNVANEQAIMRVKDVALKFTEKYPSTNLVFDLKNSEIYPTTTTNWQLTTAKLNALGWSAEISIDSMMEYLISSFIKQLALNNRTEIIPKKKRPFKEFIKWFFTVKNEGKHKCVIALGKTIMKVDRQKSVREICRNTPIQENKIVINNFNGKNLYGCHAKYIVEEILKRNLPYKIVWILRDINEVDTSCFPKQVKLVKFHSKDDIKEFASAKLLLGNVRANEYIKRGWEKKEGQYYLQTWHGSLGIKRFGTVVEKIYSPENESLLTTSEQDAKYTDMLISNSDFEDDVFKTSYCSYKGPILRVGHPRNDILYKSEDEKKKIKELVCAKYGITDKKIVLYVPTYRDNFKLDCYAIDTEKLLQALKNRFGDEFVLLVRMHPNLKYQAKILFDFSEQVINASEYADIQELLVASDIAISDYSSCIFDYMLGRNPGFIFATDLEYFNNDRGFYYPLEETPFPIATNNQELIENILNFDMDKYQKDVDRFLFDRGCTEDGHATERVVDLIEQVMDSNFK